jgi:hypothetical protein
MRDDLPSGTVPSSSRTSRARRSRFTSFGAEAYDGALIEYRRLLREAFARFVG